MSEKCPNITRCPIFPDLGRTSLATLKALYCEGVFEGCARYKSMKSGVMPARDLLPNGEKLVSPAGSKRR